MLDGWWWFLRKEDESLVRLPLELRPFYEPKFAIEIEENSIVRVERTVRVLVRTVYDLAVAHRTSVLDKGVVARPENSQFRSFWSIPEEDSFNL